MNQELRIKNYCSNVARTKKTSHFVRRVSKNCKLKIVNSDFRKNQTGFTLIELIIVIGILAVLAGMLLVSLNPFGQFQKANDARRISDLNQIQKALEQYYQDHNGVYPKTQSYEIVNFQNNQPVVWGSSWVPYMDLLPKDPLSTKKYVYYSRSDGQAYWLYASLDSSSNSQMCTSGGSGICSSLSTNNIPATACGGTCNFAVSSPNVSP